MRQKLGDVHVLQELSTVKPLRSHLELLFFKLPAAVITVFTARMP